MYQEMRSERLPNRTDVRWFHAETVTDATSLPLIIPAIGRKPAVSVTPGTSARVEYTLSDYDAIYEGTATWLLWDMGDITAPASDTAESASALRLVSIGASKWEVVA